MRHKEIITYEAIGFGRFFIHGQEMRKGEILKRLYDHVAEKGRHRPVKEVRIGLGYVGISLENGQTGLAAILLQDIASCCDPAKRAGSLKGMKASKLLRLLVEGQNPLDRALGLATANALLTPAPPYEERDAIELMRLDDRDSVAMIGYSPPLERKIRQRTASLAIIERNELRIAPMGEEQRKKALKDCSVAIITATALLNESMEETLNLLDSARHVAVLGPSTPMCPEIFASTRVNHAGGSLVLDPAAVMQIISEGGGTPAMRPHLRLINLTWKGK